MPTETAKPKRPTGKLGAEKLTGFIMCAIWALSPVPTSAETFSYMCRANGKSLSLKIDDAKNTLRWRDRIYKITIQDKCAKFGWKAEWEGEMFNFCTATKGDAYFQYGDTYQNGTIHCDQINR